MDIILKNVTGNPVNNGLLWEIRKVTGKKEGSIIYGVRHFPENKSCQWSVGTNDCTAYLGETCEEIDLLQLPF